MVLDITNAPLGVSDQEVAAQPKSSVGSAPNRHIFQTGITHHRRIINIAQINQRVTGHLIKEQTWCQSAEFIPFSHHGQISPSRQSSALS